MDTAMQQGADLELQGVEHWNQLAQRPFGLAEASASLDSDDPEVLRTILQLDTVMRLLLQSLMDYYRPNRRLEILSVGCGTANEEAYLAAIHGLLVGLDFSPQMRKRAEAQAIASGVEGKLKIIEGRATTLVKWCKTAGYEPGSFDVVILGRILMHIIQDSRRLQAIKQSLEMLKPGGLVIMYEPMLDKNAIYAGFRHQNRGKKNDHTVFWPTDEYDIAFMGMGCHKLGVDRPGQVIHHMPYLNERYDFLVYEKP